MLVIYNYILKAGVGVDGEPDNWPPKEACQRIVVALLPGIKIVFTIFPKTLKTSPRDYNCLNTINLKTHHNSMDIENIEKAWISQFYIAR